MRVVSSERLQERVEGVSRNTTETDFLGLVLSKLLLEGISKRIRELRKLLKHIRAIKRLHWQKRVSVMKKDINQIFYWERIA